MRLEDLMTTEVCVVCPDATVQDAAKLMDDENVGALPVFDGDRMVGIVTDRDIVIRSTSLGHNPTTAKVRDIMSAPVTYCFVDQTVDEAAQLMMQAYVRRLPVLDRDHQLVGIVSADDLLVEVPERAGIDVLEKVSEIERPGL